MALEALGTSVDQGFDAGLEVALEALRADCLCPYPEYELDKTAATMDLDRLQPYNDPGSEAAKTYNRAMDAFVRGVATDEQRALIVHTERIKVSLAMSQDTQPSN